MILTEVIEKGTDRFGITEDGLAVRLEHFAKGKLTVFREQGNPYANLESNCREGVNFYFHLGLPEMAGNKIIQQFEIYRGTPVCLRKTRLESY
ncbi:MAG TPA: hypothetical protein VJC39_05220 [Candidatus Nanoarchaeia archaeon]|nr:hypothetical protein [Candidatus Nanoarchaeia archaeon]